MSAYELTPTERMILQNYNQQAVNAKAKLYDLQESLNRTRAEMEAAIQMFSGTLAFLATSHDMPGATLTADFARLVPDAKGA